MKHNGGFEPRYIATCGVNVVPVRLSSEEVEGKEKVFNTWDCAGQEKFSGLGDGYYIASHAVIFFFDLTSRHSLLSVGKWVRDCSRVTRNIPFVVVGTKNDIVRGKLTDDQIREVLGDTPFFKVSSKKMEGIQFPLLALSQQLH